MRKQTTLHDRCTKSGHLFFALNISKTQRISYPGKIHRIFNHGPVENELTQSEESLRHRVLYTPLDIPLHTAYAFEKWSAWIDANKHQRQNKYSNYERMGKVYPWDRVPVSVIDGYYSHGLKSEFPEFVKHLSYLPIDIEYVIVIRQRSFLSGPFHSDLDEDGIGVRICLAGNAEDRIFKVCGFKTDRMPPAVGAWVNSTPWRKTEWGEVSERAHDMMDWSTCAHPAGIQTGVTWAVTSHSGLHATEQIDTKIERIQAIVMGKKRLDELEALLARSIDNPNCLMLKPGI